MNRRSWSILIAFTVLVGCTAAALACWKVNQKLGRPGVKVVPESTFDWEGKVVATNSVYLPDKVLDFESSAAPVMRQELGLLPKDTIYGRRLYRAPDGFQVFFSVVLMGSDRTSIHKPEFCLPGQGWVIDPGKKERAEVRIERPHSYRLPVMKWIAANARETADGNKVEVRGVYLFWFVAENELTASHLERLSWLSRDLLFTGVLQRWAYVSCFSVCAPGQEESAYQRMKEFIAAAVPEFQLTTGTVLAKDSSVSPSSSR